MNNFEISWETIKDLSPQLYKELQNILKNNKFKQLDNNSALKIINESEEISYLINNFEEYEEASSKIVELFNNLITKQLSNTVSTNNLSIIIDYIKPYENQFKNQKNIFKGIEILCRLFDTLELEPDLDLIINIYDNIQLIKENIDNIANKNIENIKNGSFTLANNNELLNSFIQVYCLKNNIQIDLENDFLTEDEIDNTDFIYDDNNDDKFLNNNYYQSDLANQIISESRKYKLLNQEELKKLIEKAQAGSSYAKEKLILHNQRLVIKIAFKYIGKKLEFVDAYQEGCIGLTKAIDKFDLSKNFNFSTYAYWWVKQAITRAIADQSRLIRIPVHMTEKISKFKKIENELANTLNRVPSIEELAKAMHCKKETVIDLIEASQDTISYNTKVGDEEDSELIDFIVQDSNIESEIENNSFEENVNKFMQSLNLPDRLIYVALHRLDIPGYKKETLEVIGQKFNITRERIRQLEKKARKKIFFSNHAKEFCELFPNPEKMYKLILKERENYYKNPEENDNKSNNDLLSKINTSKENLLEYIQKLNEKDQRFIKSHYDKEFNVIEEAWDIDDEEVLRGIINRIRLVIKNPNYKARENPITKKFNNDNITKEIIENLTPKLPQIDQTIIYSVFDEEFNARDVILTKNLSNQLNKIIYKFKKLLDNPDFDLEKDTNLANILGITYEELDDLTIMLSKNNQRFLLKHYDENYNEKTYKTKEEELELKKIICFLKQLKIEENNTPINKNFINDEIGLNTLEIIIVMGLISGQSYNTKYIANFLNLEEEQVINLIREYLLNLKNKHACLLSDSYTLILKKKDEVNKECN